MKKNNKISKQQLRKIDKKISRDEEISDPGYTGWTSTSKIFKDKSKIIPRKQKYKNPF